VAISLSLSRLDRYHPKGNAITVDKQKIAMIKRIIFMVRIKLSGSGIASLYG